MFIVFIILVVVVIGWFLLGSYHQGQYDSSSEKHWKDKVLSFVDSIQSAQKREQNAVSSLSREEQQEVERLESDAINTLLKQLSIGLLVDYPGIGPSTVEKLKLAGFNTMLDIRTRDIYIQGIGDKRLNDIRAAHTQLFQQSLSKFKNSTTPESLLLAQAIKTTHEAFSEKKLICEARLKAFSKLNEYMKEAEIAARKISYNGYLDGSNGIHVPEKLQKMKFPDLAATLEKAERRAKLKYLEKMERSLNELDDDPVSELEEGLTPASNIDIEATPKPVPPPAPVSTPEARKSVNEPRPAPTPLQFLDQQAKPPPPAIDPLAELLQSSAPSLQPPPLPVNIALFEPVNLAQELLEITVELGYLIARADGRLSQTEQQFIDDYLDQRYRSDAAMHTKARTLSAHCAKASIPIGPLIERIRKQCPREAMMHLLDFAKDVALAGNLNDKKHQCYLDVGKRLGLTLPALDVNKMEPSKPVPAPVNVIKTRPPPRPPPPPHKPAPSPEVAQRQALEIDPGVPLSADLVRRQFNKLAERFQSAKVAHLGAEFTKLADERFAAAKSAADSLLHIMGETLVIPTKPVEPAGLRENKELDELFGG